MEEFNPFLTLTLILLLSFGLGLAMALSCPKRKREVTWLLEAIFAATVVALCTFPPVYVMLYAGTVWAGLVLGITFEE